MQEPDPPFRLCDFGHDPKRLCASVSSSVPGPGDGTGRCEDGVDLWKHVTASQEHRHLCPHKDTYPGQREGRTDPALCP